MTLPPFDLLSAIIARFATRFRRLDGLTVNNTEGWLRVSSFDTAYLLTQCIVDAFPCAVFSPHIIVVPHMSPVRKLFWQHPPLTAGFGTVKECVHNFTQINRSFASASIWLFGKRLNNEPFSIGTIARIAF